MEFFVLYQNLPQKVITTMQMSQNKYHFLQKRFREQIYCYNDILSADAVEQ
jgi:hypothetical protein